MKSNEKRTEIISLAANILIQNDIGTLKEKSRQSSNQSDAKLKIKKDQVTFVYLRCRQFGCQV